MKRLTKKLFFLSAALLFILGSLNITSPAARGTPVISGAEASANWTLAIYMDSDNDLDFWAQKDINEMMMLGSSSKINVIVFWDSFTGPGYVYRVLQGGLQELPQCKLDGIEPNMGDPSTLRGFTEFVFKKFPAKHRALMLWDHGDDFRGVMFDNHIPGEGFDLLTHQEVVQALSGFKIDVLIYAACVMSTIEVVYEYYASGLNIDCYVANEGYDPMDGFPYDSILAKLRAKPDMTSLDFANLLVDEYIGYYTNQGKAYSQSVTLSALQVNQAGRVVSDLQSMIEAIRSDTGHYAQIVSDARGHANLPWSENGWERLIDLTMFVKTIRAESLDPQKVWEIDPAVVDSVVSSSELLLQSLSEATVYFRNTPAMDKKGCYGLAVYFPTSRDSFERNWQIYGTLYSLMKFAGQGWLDFLYDYWSRL